MRLVALYHSLSDPSRSEVNVRDDSVFCRQTRHTNIMPCRRPRASKQGCHGELTLLYGLWTLEQASGPRVANKKA